LAAHRACLLTAPATLARMRVNEVARLQGVRIAVCTLSTVGLGAEEARWRPSAEFINQSPGCREGKILAPVPAWHYYPAAGPFWPWDILD
jgi:hypothetical protein